MGTRKSNLLKLIDGKIWLKKYTLFDTIGLYDHDIVDIIAVDILRKTCTCVLRPRDIRKPLNSQMFEVENFKIKIPYIRTDYFSLLITEQFKQLLIYKNVKLLINEKSRKIIYVLVLSSSGWSSIECNISIPLPKGAL